MGNTGLGVPKKEREGAVVPSTWYFSNCLAQSDASVCDEASFHLFGPSVVLYVCLVVPSSGNPKFTIGCPFHVKMALRTGRKYCVCAGIMSNLDAKFSVRLEENTLKGEMIQFSCMWGDSH